MPSDAAQSVVWNTLGRSAAEEPRDVFALLDAARARSLPDYLAQWEAESACLFAEESDPSMLVRAPYLVRVREKSELSNWLLSDGWGQSWGIYAMAPAGTEFDIVLRDFREVLHARLPDRRIVLFRFFDPRVWRPFFLTCDAAQLKLLFGRTVCAFGCEDETGNAILLDTIREGAPQRRVIDLQT